MYITHTLDEGLRRGNEKSRKKALCTDGPFHGLKRSPEALPWRQWCDFYHPCILSSPSCRRIIFIFIKLNLDLIFISRLFLCFLVFNFIPYFLLCICYPTHHCCPSYSSRPVACAVTPTVTVCSITAPPPLFPTAAPSLQLSAPFVDSYSLGFTLSSPHKSCL